QVAVHVEHALAGDAVARPGSGLILADSVVVEVGDRVQVRGHGALRRADPGVEVGLLDRKGVPRSGVEADLAGSVGGGETVLEGGSAVVGASRGPRSVQLAGSHGKLVRLARFGRGGVDASILAGPGGRVRAVVPAADYRITDEVDVMAGDE